MRLICTCVAAFVVVCTAGCGGTPEPANSVDCAKPATPHLTSVSPTILQQFVSGQVLVVRGDTFGQNSQIEVNGSALTTLFFSANELHETVPAELVNFKQQLSIRVATTIIVAEPSNLCSGVTSYSGFLYVTVQ